MISHSHLASLSRKDLQMMAKKYGVKGNQSNAELVAAILITAAAENRSSLSASASSSSSSSIVMEDAQSSINNNNNSSSSSNNSSNYNKVVSGSAVMKTKTPMRGSLSGAVGAVGTPSRSSLSCFRIEELEQAKFSSAPHEISGSVRRDSYNNNNNNYNDNGNNINSNNRMTPVAAVSTTTIVEVTSYESCIYGGFEFGDLLFIKHGDTYCDVKITRINKKTARVMYLSNESEATVPFEDILRKVVERRSITEDTTKDFCELAMQVGEQENNNDLLDSASAIADEAFAPVINSDSYNQSIVPFSSTPKKTPIRCSVELVSSSAFKANSPAPLSMRKSIKRNFDDMYNHENAVTNNYSYSSSSSSSMVPQRPELTTEISSHQSLAARRLSSGLHVVDGSERNSLVAVDPSKAPAVKVKMNKAQYKRQMQIATNQIKSDSEVDTQKKSSSAFTMKKSSSFIYPSMEDIYSNSSSRASITAPSSNSNKRPKTMSLGEAVKSASHIPHNHNHSHGHNHIAASNDSFRARQMPDFKSIHNKVVAGSASFHNMSSSSNNVKTAAVGWTIPNNALSVSNKPPRISSFQPAVTSRQQQQPSMRTSISQNNFQSNSSNSHSSSNSNRRGVDRNAQMNNVKAVLANINKENHIAPKNKGPSSAAYGAVAKSRVVAATNHHQNVPQNFPQNQMKRRAEAVVDKRPITAPPTIRGNVGKVAVIRPNMPAQQQRKLSISDRVAMLVDDDNPFNFVNM